MTPEQVQQLVTIAFTLEALSEKEGCTSRTTDIPGKPLEDFLIAGINSGQVFSRFAQHAQNGLANTLQYLPEALAVSNEHKQPKTVNFGLLEVMFFTVHARLTSSNDVFARLDQLLDENANDAVRSALEARTIAWSTSHSPSKRNFDASKYQHHDSIRNLYSALRDDYDASHANYQWSEHAFVGYPILRGFYESLPPAPTEMIRVIPDVHARLRQEYPETKIGILADMCAAAIFLKLADQV